MIEWIVRTRVCAIHPQLFMARVQLFDPPTEPHNEGFLSENTMPMRTTWLLGSFAISTICLQAANAQQWVTLSGPTSVFLCSIDPVTDVFTANYPSLDQDNDYTWHWRRDGVTFLTMETQSVSTCQLPIGNILGGTHQYDVLLTVNYNGNITTPNSNVITCTATGNSGSYNPASVGGMMVSGDFDNDGKVDDEAAIYSYSSDHMAIHVWKTSNSNNAFEYQGDGGWWNGAPPMADPPGNRVVCGDFDNDGYEDDIAALYGSGASSRMCVWRSSGSAFSPYALWWSNTAYSANQVNGRMVAGDFDNDGFKDDIAMMYDYTNALAKIHVLRSNGSAFSNFAEWYNSGTGMFAAQNVAFRFVSGDFDSDGKFDDICGLYDYNGTQTKAWVFRSNGTSFGSPQMWWDSGIGNFNDALVVGRVVSGDFDRDGTYDDVAAVYSYPNQTSAIFVWKGTNTAFTSPTQWWNSGSGAFNADRITNRLVSGDFNRDGKRDDLVAMYDYLNNSVRDMMWRSNSTSFTGPLVYWEACAGKSLMHHEVMDGENKVGGVLSAYPIPTDRELIVDLSAFGGSPCSLAIHSLLGGLERQFRASGKTAELDLQDLPAGVYLMTVSDGATSKSVRIVKN